MKRCNIKALKESLQNVNWDDLLHDLDANSQFEKFHQILCDQLDHHCPVETKFSSG